MRTRKVKTKKPKPNPIQTNRESRKKYLSDNLPPLDKYREKMKTPDIARWFAKAQTYVRAFLAEGLAPEEIQERLGINEAHYDQIEQALLESSGARFIKQGTAHRYYNYMLRMEQCLRELDDFIAIHIEDDPKKSGVVGAIKAKASILNDVLKTGQDLGIISKRAKELQVIGEVNLAVIPTDELKQMYEEKMNRFDQIMQRAPSLPPAYQRILNNAIDGTAEEVTKDANEEENQEAETQAS